MNPLFRIDFSISDSLKIVRKSVLIYETIIYGLDTAFVYEYICKKELHPVFPLRNGEKKNMNTAIDLISHYWQQSDDCMLQIYDDIQTAFNEKSNSNCNKQIVSLCNT